MQNYIWILVLIFVAAVIAYLKSIRNKEEENCGDERYLIGMGGIYGGQTFPIGKEIVIGRDVNQCGIIYPNGSKGVSSVHCKVRIENERVALIDLSSSYGTFRDNGERLSSNMVYYLGPGDGFYVGDAENIFLVK